MNIRRRAVPTVLQIESAECGAACLTMVLASFGRHETLDAVRAACGTSRDGMSVGSLIEAAKCFGIEARTYRKEVEELSRLPFPQVLFWSFNHFVVLEAVRGNRFIINDPACGRRTLGRAEFGRHFTGVTLLFALTDAFRRAKPRSRLVPALVRQLAGSAGAFAGVLATTALLGLLGVLLPGFTRVFIDDYLVRQFGDWLMPLLIGMALVALLRAFLTWLNVEGLLLLRTKITAVLSAQFVWRLLHLPYMFFAQRSPNEVGSRVQLAGSVAGTVAGPFASLMSNGVLIVAYGLLMLTYDALLTAIVVALATLNGLLLWWVGRRVEESGQRVQMASGNAHAIIIQGLALLEDHRATGTEGLLFERMTNGQVALLNAEQQAGRLQKLLGAAPMVGSQLTSLSVLCVGAYQVATAEMTIGLLLAFQMLAELFSAPVSALVTLGSAVRGAGASVARLSDVLDAPPAATAGATASRLRGRIAADDLVVSYGSAAPILRGVSISVAEGELVAVCGGAGKSTLARALCGLLPPASGSVRIDGTPIVEIDPASVGATIGFVEQTPFFPAGRLRDALTLWDGSIAQTEIEAALRDACMLDIINNRPGSLDSRLGEGGSGFSGGERQRLALARALAHDPAILILDDATSALDEKTEAAVLANLRRRGVTVVLMTNRASALRQVDRVILLHDGEVGTFPGSARPGPSEPQIRREAA